MGLALALFTTLAALLAGWLLETRLHAYRRQVHATASVRIGSVKETLTLSFEQLVSQSINLAHRPRIREYLAVPRPAEPGTLSEAELDRRFEAQQKQPELKLLREILDSVANDFGLPLASLAWPDGELLVSTDARSTDGRRIPLKRLNLRQRDFFSGAMARGSASQFLIGRTSKTPGIYFAARIDVEGAARGVALVKQDPETLNHLLSEPSGGMVFVTDAQGTIVLANRGDLLLHRIPGAPDLGEPAMQTLYQGTPERLAWGNAPLSMGAQAVSATTAGGLRYVTLSSPLGNWPFTLWVLGPLGEESTITTEVLAVAAALWLLGCGLIGLAWRGTHWIDTALQARRELLDMTRALPLTVFRYKQPLDDGPGRFSFLGRGVDDLFGIGPEQLKQDPTLPWRLAGDAARHPPTARVEFAVRHDHGATWVLAHSTPQPQPDGSTVYNGYWLDVSARREAESRFAAVFEHAPNGYVFFDRKRGITHCNPATLALFRASDAGQLLGRVLWFPTLTPELQPDGQASKVRVLELMRRHTRSGERVQGHEWRFCRLDGTTFDSEVSVIAIAWEGEPQFCAVVQDVTERKLAQAAMRQARDAAEAASQTKSTFLANMSHELRTPMNAIIGMTHLALEDGLPARQHDYIDKAHGAARNLLQILNDILDVSKIEAGRLELERIDFELETVVREMADVLGLKADEKGLELLFSAAPDLPPRLVGDPTRLRQVLVNLGSNAIKFTDAGEVIVGMELLSQEAERVELHGWVRDTGPGLSEDQLSRIFQPFTQADSSTTRRFGGTGLGLVISRQLVERMGGRLWVESTPGRGSTFHFSVRLERSAPRAPGRAWMLGELRGRRALLVDDNAAALDVLGRMLEGFGIEVDRADGGPSALDLLQAQPEAYAWILLDWKMPVMDGVTCARLILDRYPHLRPCILLVTAFARDDALRAAAGVPLAGLLQKPVTPSSLHDGLLQATRSGMPVPRDVPADDAPSANAVRQRLAGARILLVEDHPLNQELACELLRRAGMQVVVAGDGRLALDALARQGPFDGVLMDCQMPVMDGYTATRTLRADPRWRGLPVIAMTASALVEDRARALDSGMNAHITKPIHVELMLRTMAEWIDVHRAPSTDSPAPAETGWPPPDARRSIDTADGMARCLGKAALYRRVLRGFRDTTRSFAEQFRSALAESRWDDALRAVHDLKGLAGTIGAHRLYADAEALRAAAAARDSAAVLASLARLCEQLDTVLAEIDELLAMT